MAPAPCDFCPLPAIISGQRTRVTGTVRRGAARYAVTIFRLVCGDGSPLGLHVMRRLSERDVGGGWRDTEPGGRPGRLWPRGSFPTELATVEDLVGTASPWLQVKELVHTVAKFPRVSVLIVGETGTGKDLVAQAIHVATHDSTAPFVPINCASIPESLLESELFGYERGAFTGATQTKPGLFELANRGTLFLDEIGSLSLALQPKLLRVLDSKCFTRLGGTRSIRIDSRLVWANSTPLRDLIEADRFREDLFQRLSTFTIDLPPLRERREDIPVLAATFLTQAASRLGRRLDGMTPGALAVLTRYAWPGNVRELRKVIDRGVILTAPGTLMEPRVLPPELLGGDRRR